MPDRGLDQQDVYTALVELIGSDDYEVGARLPSCRALATRIGSNPNTVNRALQTLQEEGLVRTVPRTGTFVTGMPTHHVQEQRLDDEMGRLVRRALTTGLAPDAVRRALDEALERAQASPSVVFAECNGDDLDEMSTAIEHVSGLRLEPVLLDDVEGEVSRRSSMVLLVPLFHLGDVRALEIGTTPVVEIPFVPDPDQLVELASLDPSTAVTVASRHPRGIERVASSVRQYFGGPVEERLLGRDDADLSDVEVLVYNNGAQLRSAEIASAPATIKLSVMLDGRAASTLRSRMQQVAQTS